MVCVVVRSVPDRTYQGRADRSGLIALAEWGRTEDLDATVLLGRGVDAAHVYRPGIDAPTVIVRHGFACVPVERLTAARCVEAQQPSAFGAGDLEGVRDASWGAGDHLIFTNPISATFTTCDVTVPKLRYITDPSRPALQGTTKLAA